MALVIENSTNSLKVEAKTKQSCKVLIYILQIPFFRRLNFESCYPQT